jgi:ubiquinone/menaquinone biosynthesis C-methylase UbiE
MSSWISRLWSEHVLPVAVDRCCGQRHVERQRRKVVPAARGRVLELGIGTGLNLAHYDPEQVREVVAIDPSRALLERARARAVESPVPVHLSEGTAEALEHDRASFDTVVVTYALCTIPAPARALAEVARVLAPGGLFVVLEHGASPDPGPRAWQRRLDPAWSRLGGGCHLGRPMRALIEEAGFDTGALEEGYLPGPRWLNYHYWGALER